MVLSCVDGLQEPGEGYYYFKLRYLLWETGRHVAFSPSQVRSTLPTISIGVVGQILPVWFSYCGKRVDHLLAAAAYTTRLDCNRLHYDGYVAGYEGLEKMETPATPKSSTYLPKPGHL